MGVTRVNPENRTVRCVLMTLEGFVLLDADTDKTLTIHRGVSPFDSTDFVRGLMEDIQLAFFQPPGEMIRVGTLEDHTFVCRYKMQDGRTADVMTRDDGTWEIRGYGRNSALARSIKALKPGKPSKTGHGRIPDRIRLEAHGMNRYALTLDLIEAEPDSE